MAVKNSQEFAEAWRLVSEALLAYIQSGGSLIVPSPEGSGDGSLAPQVPSQETPSAEKSPEFANAWRLVSESILAYIQSGGSLIVPSPEGSGDGSLAPQVPSQETPSAEKSPEKTIKYKRYAACPIGQNDGSYIFKNLKDVCQEESTYELTLYTDDSCDFELCDLQGEQRQILKDNRDYWMPEKVCILKGKITIDNPITTIKKGKGRVVGSSVEVIEPLVAEAAEINNIESE